MDNRVRISNIEGIIGNYYYSDSLGAVDILADLMHYCKAKGLNFEADLKTARMHFEAEMKDEQS